MPFLYDVLNVKLQQYAKGLGISLVTGEGGGWGGEQGFQPIFLNGYLSNEKNNFADN